MGLLAGLGLVYWLSLTWLDNATAILFGVIIIYTGFRLLRTSLAGIMDEADYQLISEAVTVLDHQRPDNWIDVQRKIGRAHPTLTKGRDRQPKNTGVQARN